MTEAGSTRNTELEISRRTELHSLPEIVMKKLLCRALLLAAFLPFALPKVHAEVSCASLMSLKIAGADIIFAGTVAPGAFAAPGNLSGGRDLTAPFRNVPAFCRVVAVAKPTEDSNIRVEVWMPASGWNGKLQAIGNGGFAGQIDYEQLGAILSKGYSATATDTGHSGSPIDAKWALGHPEKVADFGHRGVHE